MASLVGGRRSASWSGQGRGRGVCAEEGALRGACAWVRALGEAGCSPGAPSQVLARGRGRGWKGRRVGSRCPWRAPQGGPAPGRTAPRRPSDGRSTLEVWGPSPSVPAPSQDSGPVSSETPPSPPGLRGPGRPGGGWGLPWSPGPWAAGSRPLRSSGLAGRRGAEERGGARRRRTIGTCCLRGVGRSCWNRVSAPGLSGVRMGDAGSRWYTLRLCVEMQVTPANPPLRPVRPRVRGEWAVSGERAIVSPMEAWLAQPLGRGLAAWPGRQEPHRAAGGCGAAAGVGPHGSARPSRAPRDTRPPTPPCLSSASRARTRVSVNHRNAGAGVWGTRSEPAAWCRGSRARVRLPAGSQPPCP